MDYIDETDRTSNEIIDVILVCEPTSTFKAQDGMKQWCNDNCNHVPKNCPSSMCVCKGDSSGEFLNGIEAEEDRIVCAPTTPFKHVSGMTKWCDDNCNGATKFCPETFCTCM